jgi:hypothetical protein
MGWDMVRLVIAVVLWTVAMVGFVVLAGVVLGWLPADWWAPPVGIAASGVPADLAD